MSRFANPLRCPDCRSSIEYGAAACARCGLPLRGNLAEQLFVTLSRADELLAALRATTRAAATSPADPRVPAPVVAPPAPRTAGLSASSVPKILLTLGAACLLVAALVFLAVTWSVMGVGGRTATLVGITAVTGVMTGIVAARGLRGATESLGLVTLGLGALDVAGADHSGWFGDLSASSFLVLLGAIVAFGAAAASLVLRRTPSGAFTSGEVVTGLGTGVAAVGLGSGDWSSDELRLLLATVGVLAAVATLHRLRLVVATIGTAAVAVLSWLALAGEGVEAVTTPATVDHVWGELAAWPLLAAAVLVVGVALVRSLHIAARQAAVSVGVAVVAFVAVVPALDGPATPASLAVLSVLAVSAAVLWFAPRPWSAAAALSLLASGLVAVALAALLAGTAADRVLEAVSEQGDFLGRLPRESMEVQPWLLPLAVAGLVAAGAASFRFAGITVGLRGWLPFLGVATLAATAALYPLPVWALVAAGLVAAACFLVSGDLAFAAVCLAGAAGVSLYAEGLTAIALPVAVLASWWVHLRDQRTEVSVSAAAAAQLALGGSVWTWGSLLDVPGELVAAIGIAAVSVVAIGAAYLPGHRGVSERVGLELGAAAASVGLFLGGGLATTEVPTWVAIYLTIFGAAVCIQSLLRADQRGLGWAGGVLLAAATWVRLADIGVHQPEPYTLPSGVALLVVGLVHLRRNPGASTMSALSPGLGLALIPSLLWVLAEPATLRSLLLGFACLVLVVVGVELKWTAPLAAASGVGALVVLRHAAPYIGETVERWVLIGLAGTLLVALGITWEQRLREARAVLGYVKGLR